MQIQNHRLVGVPFVASPNISGMLNPQYVTMHYTAGWSGQDAIATLTNPAAKVSAHVVIDRDGSVTQLVPFNRVAWHAGPSKYDGKNGMNHYAIGIELVNIGFLRQKAGGYQLWNGSKWSSVSSEHLKGYDLSLSAPNSRIGGGSFVWPAYTAPQIAAAKDVFAASCAYYPIKDVVSHEEIDTRKWKTDPGPAFPMGEFKDMLHAGAGRDDGLAPMGTFEVNVAALNVRSQPNTNASVLTVIRRGDNVAVQQDLGVWSHVEYAPGKFGYVTDKYLKAA